MEVREIEFPPKDAGLRADVSALGALVGDVIREQAGDDLFQDVEAARKAAIRRREGEPGAEAELNRILCFRTPAGAEELVRSFSTYFQVVNLAEKVHRIRRRRDHLRDESEPQRGSLDDAIRTLRQAGRELVEVQALFSDLLVEPVFTAHPSQATRRTILEKQQRIARCLLDRLDPSMTPPENRASWERIRADVTSAWQTEEHPFERPTVSDELEHVLFYMTDVIYRIIPPFYEALEGALTRTYGAEAASVRIPPIVRFASWVGGDMDGNPNVTSDTIFASLGRQRELILARHQQEVGLLARQLSQSLSRIAVDDEVLARIDRYTPLFTDAITAIPTRHRGMPYRVLLQLMAARLDASARDAAEGHVDQPHAQAVPGRGAAGRRSRGWHAGLVVRRRRLPAPLWA